MSTALDTGQLSLWPQVGHRNHYLFSDYYLSIRLPTLEIWQKPSGLPTTFTYFYLFFYREAFLGVERQQSFLARVFDQAFGNKYNERESEAVENRG